MSQNLRVILITAISFAFSYYYQKLFFADIHAWFDSFLPEVWMSYLITYAIEAIPLFIGLILIHGTAKYSTTVGLNAPLAQGALIAFLWTLPMLIGYAVVFDFNTEITASKIITGSLIAGFVEELFFRGFLFGQVYRYSKLGFVPSIIFGALIFASGHLYQSTDPATLIGVFMTTFLGAILFAWVYAEWKFNLWVPIFLHIFMNLFWMLFSAGENALGGNNSNLFRVMTICAVIISTILYKRRKGIKLEVNRSTVWMKK